MIAFLIVFFACLAALEFFNARRPGFALAGVQECRVAYERAKSYGDSAMVDVTRPATGPQKTPNAPTCGTMRITGALR